MNKETTNTFKQLNTCVCPKEDMNKILSVDSALYEMRIQLAGLNQRAEHLSKALNNIANQQELEKLKRTYYNI